MGFFYNPEEVIIVFDDEKELLTERTEIELSVKNKTTIVYIRSRVEDGVSHAASIKIYSNTKKESNAVGDLFVTKTDKIKEQKIKDYNTRIFSFAKELVSVNKTNLLSLWDKDRSDPEYDILTDKIIYSLNNLEDVKKGRVVIRKVIRK